MKRMLSLMLVLSLVLLCGCGNEATQNTQMNLVDPEEIPDVFQSIISTNAFYDVTASGDRLLKTFKEEVPDQERTNRHHIIMMDFFGKELASYSCVAEESYHVSTLTATSDGGFLFTLGFIDHAYGQDSWASDNGFASRVVKCDAAGNLQFDTSLPDVSKGGLSFCIEKEGKYYFFGDIETSATKRRGVGSPTDVYMVSLDQNGEVLKTKTIGGKDFDRLENVDASEDGFVLSVSAQSDDGDFAGSASRGYLVDWVVTVNDDFEITEKKKETGRSTFDRILGVKDGKLVRSEDSLVKDYDAGSPMLLIDYGDTYLIVSERTTGEYENTPPYLSSIWRYTETVYSWFDNNGSLIYREAVDSSPDFDAMAEAFMNR